MTQTKITRWKDPIARIWRVWPRHAKSGTTLRLIWAASQSWWTIPSVLLIGQCCKRSFRPLVQTPPVRHQENALDLNLRSSFPPEHAQIAPQLLGPLHQ